MVPTPQLASTVTVAPGSQQVGGTTKLSESVDAPPLHEQKGTSTRADGLETQPVCSTVALTGAIFAQPVSVTVVVPGITVTVVSEAQQILVQLSVEIQLAPTRVTS